MKEYFTLERKVELGECEREGITAHQFSSSKDADYLVRAREKGVKLHFFGLHTDIATLREAIQIIRPSQWCITAVPPIRASPKGSTGKFTISLRPPTTTASWPASRRTIPIVSGASPTKGGTWISS